MIETLTEQEKVLFSAIPARRKEYDVIMTYGENNKGVLKHELSHVLSKRDREYQAQVLQTFGRFQESEFDWKSLQKELLAAGYRKEEVPIELNAIMIELNIIHLAKYLERSRIRYESMALIKTKENLDSLFEKHWRKKIHEDKARKLLRRFFGNYFAA